MNTRQKLLNDRLRQYVAAESAILRGQSYTINNRQLTRASLAEVRRAIDDLISQGAVLDDNETPSARRTKQVVLHD